mgnify:CR=1 FL=1
MSGMGICQGTGKKEVRFKSTYLPRSLGLDGIEDSDLSDGLPALYQAVLCKSAIYWVLFVQYSMLLLQGRWI